MGKIKLCSAVILLSLFAVTNFALAVKIENPLAPGGVNDFPQLLSKIAGAVAALVGTLAVIMLIIAAILFLTSAGSPERTKKAKDAFWYAVIGMIIAGAAQAIKTAILKIIGA